ncbi:disease resistance protein (TIR-NBS-LRR class) [Trifolium pratense]|uniref:Disease resistance protein (TIR-NBS-LRR class) n=1 Tax=Trifolium pratense TaxID=57577 RepID=A0A2K3PPG2_TRIPR|nr:disease resistance protein (TIR-NBS-LRR class) [Trifolium pratense]
MKKLRLLQLDCVDLTGDFGYLSKQLRWVNWQRSTFNYIPNDFDLGNLIVFELKYSNVEQVWKENKLLQKLKILNLSHSKHLKSTPDFSKLPNLEKLIMKDCQSLSEVHSSIGDLKNILLINLKDCTSLGNLPTEIYQLASVKILILSGCSNIDKLEEDIGKMKSLTTIAAKNTGVKQVPVSIVRSKSIRYISLCGYEGLSRDIFPSIIRSWMSPTMNSLAHIPPFGGMSTSLVSLNVDSGNMGLVYQSPLLGSGSKLRSVSVQCDSEIQLKQELRRFLDDLYGAGLTEVGASHASQISDLSLRSLLFGIGSCHMFIDILGKNLSQGLSDYDSRDSFLPGDNYPSWLAYKCEGPSVPLQVPENCDFSMKGITLCVIYSSTHENLATECLPSLLIINYTKFTIQIYKRDTIYKQDTVRSFNGEDWQGIISNLGVGDNLEIFVAIGHGFTVKETAVYLVYDQSNAMEIEQSNTMKVVPSTDTKIESLHKVEVQPPDVQMEPSTEVKVQPSPNVKTAPSAEVEVQSSPDVKMEPSLVVENEQFPNTDRKIFTRFAKRVGECLCLNQN